MKIINTTNITSEIKQSIYVKEHKNVIIQNEITCGVNDSISVKYYGTIFEDADIDSDNYWCDITSLLFNADAVVCANETVRKLGSFDTNVSLVKIKIVVSVISADPNNKVEIEYEC